MKNFFTSMLGAMAALAVFSAGAALCLFIVIAAIGASMGGGERPVFVEKGAFLVFDMSMNVTDAPEQIGSGALLGALLGDSDEPRRMQLRQITGALKMAAADSRVAGVFLHGAFSPAGYGTGYAALREIREALAEVRAAKKPVIAYLETAGVREMYVASLADEVTLDCHGMIMMPGLASQPVFFAGALEKFGVGAQVTRVGKYKSAVEPFTRSEMSEESREQTQKLLDDLWGDLRNDIALGRGLGAQELQALVDKEGIIRPEVALRKKLVTRLAYRDEVIEELKVRTGRGGTSEAFKQVSLGDYASMVSPAAGPAARPGARAVLAEAEAEEGAPGKDGAGEGVEASSGEAKSGEAKGGEAKGGEVKSGEARKKGARVARAARGGRGAGGGTVAIVYAEGVIVEGNGGMNDVGGASYAREIRRLRQDEKVKAIVLRVNSPGGSAMASEHILRELRLAREVKPVVVSMGAYAASGGYWIATYGDRIFAEPGTLTGSIGVFGVLFDVQKLAGSVGVTFDSVKTGKYADTMTIARPKTPEEMELFQKMVDWIYDEFVGRVAESRNLPAERVREIAQGRVWSGTEALALGLVDEIGGLDDAIVCAAEKAGLGGGYFVSEFPRKKELAEVLALIFGERAPEQSDSVLSLRPGARGAVDEVLARVRAGAQILNQFNDPRGIYARMPLELVVR